MFSKKRFCHPETKLPPVGAKGNVVKDLAKCPGRRNSSGELKFPSSQPTLSYRVGPARDPSAAMLCQDDTIAAKIEYYSYIIFYFYYLRIVNRN